MAIVHTLVIGAKSRATIRANDVEGLDNSAFSTVVESVERTAECSWSGRCSGTRRDALRRAYGARPVEQRRDATWYFAEGSQGFFDTYVLPGQLQHRRRRDVTVTFLLRAGRTDRQLEDDRWAQRRAKRSIAGFYTPSCENQSFGLLGRVGPADHRRAGDVLRRLPVLERRDTSRRA